MFPVPTSERRASRGQDMGVMSQPVQQGGGELGIAEDLYPFSEGQIGRDKGRPALIPLR